MKFARSGDDVVGGKDHHHGFRIAGQDDVRSEPKRGRGVASCGLRDDLRERHTRQGAAHLALNLRARENVRAAGWDHARNPIESLFEECLLSEEAEQLFWLPATAERPEARAAAPGQDNGVSVVKGAVRRHNKNIEKQWTLSS